MLIKHAATLFEDNDADNGKRKQNMEDKFNSRMMRTKNRYGHDAVQSTK